MISPLVLEQPGRWRHAAIAILVLPVLPILPLMLQAGSPTTWLDVGSAFWRATSNSLSLAFLVGGVGWLMGLPLGVLAGLFRFRCKTVLVALLALPLLVPSFLWAIGWMSLASRVGPWACQIVEGWVGCVFVFSAGALSLTTFASLAATRSITASAAEAARLAGGDGLLVRLALRWAAVPAAIAAMLASVLTLADPGPGQILGVQTVASDILISFASSYDYSLAARQSMWITIMVLVVVTPICAFATPRLVIQILTKQVRPLQPLPPVHDMLVSAVFVAVTTIVLLIPLAGLVLPLSRLGDLHRAVQEVLRTATSTLVYAAGSAGVACLMGTVLAIGVGRQNRLRALTLVCSLVAFSLPPSALALGFLAFGSRSPACADWLFRSQLTVVLAIGLRLLPVVTVLALRGFGAVPGSYAGASAISGVSLAQHLRRILLPALRPALVAAGVLVALLGSADVGTVLLLHPPGRPNLPLAIFTIMGNAPESLVAALCLLYMATAGVVLWLLAWRGRGRV